MALKITWVVEQMSCYPEHDGKQDVVFTVFWRVNGSDDDCFGTVYGSQGVSYDGGLSFTPYADLTQEQVIGWVKDAMGQERVDEIEVNVAKQIENQKNPPVVTPPLPWASSPTP